MRENYRILGTAVGFSPEETIFTRRSIPIFCCASASRTAAQGWRREQTAVCDGLLTDEPARRSSASVRTARRCCCLTPCGRPSPPSTPGGAGTAQGIAYKAVLRMQAEFGCAPEHIHAAIGRASAAAALRSGRRCRRHAAIARPDAEAAIELHGEKAHVDLKRLNRIWLERAGVQVIDICPDCTKCQPERFWSHRVTGGNRGSQAAIIRLKGGAPA